MTSMIDLIARKSGVRPAHALIVAAVCLGVWPRGASGEEAAAAAPAAAAPARTATPGFKDERDARSYAIGMSMAAQLRQKGSEVNFDAFMKGMKDASDGKTMMTQAQAKSLMVGIQKEAKSKRVAARSEASARNKQEGEEFLQKNRAREGVVTLESGLQYKVLTAGKGATPSADDTVLCKYRGTFIDGTEFDSSEKQGKPIAFPVKGVIKGWTEALQRMPVGSKWQLFVPSSLAYGERGAGRVIGPDTALIFEVELLAIETPKVGAAPAKSGAEQDPKVAADAAKIQVLFKLDPRISGATYGGDHWVSPKTFTAPSHDVNETTVVARVEGVGRAGQPTRIPTTWKVEDPAMVSLARGQGDVVAITVKRPGTSTLSITSAGVSKDLLVKATPEGKGLQVVISQ